jgi:hypothetical protein
MNDKIPCRVSGDLRRYQAAQNDAEVESFDEYQLEHVKAVVGERFAQSVQNLLLAYRQFVMTRDSFGVDTQKFAEVVIPKLKSLREDCVIEWNDL